MADGDRDLARWQGELEARVATLERLQHGLLVDVADMSKAIVRVETGVESCREEVRKAAEQIEKGKDDAVRKLESTITTAAAEQSAWRITKFHVFVGSLFAFIVALISTLVAFAITGSVA